MRSELRSTGFSQNTALPAAAARSMRSAWVSVGVPISTASMSWSAMISSIDAHRRAGRCRKRVGAIRHGIGDGGEPARRRRGDVAAVDLADAPRAQERESKSCCLLLDELRRIRMIFHIDCQWNFCFIASRDRQRARGSARAAEATDAGGRVHVRAERSTSSPSAAPPSISTASRSARGWRISAPLPSRSAAARPTSPSARRGSA